MLGFPQLFIISYRYIWLGPWQIVRDVLRQEGSFTEAKSVSYKLYQKSQTYKTTGSPPHQGNTEIEHITPSVKQDKAFFLRRTIYELT